jgi:hemerythrin-like domain-containing protein
MNPTEPRDRSSVDEVLGADHVTLGVLLQDLTHAVQTGSPGAGKALSHFARELNAHMDWEEQTLFPSVRERATAAQKRSIESLEIDHERLRETLSHLELAVAGGDLRTARDLVAWLVTLLQGHNYDEEHGVYVEADRYLTVEERRRMIGSFQLDSRKERA